MQKDRKFLSIVIVLILVLVIGIPIRGEKEKSIAENRSLTYFPKLSMKSFISSDFQSGIENALTDQILFGETFKTNYNVLKNKNIKMIVDLLGLFESDKEIVAIKSDEEDYKDKETKTDMVFSEVKEILIIEEQPNIVEILPEYNNFQIDLTPFGGNLVKIDETDHLLFSNKTLEQADNLLQLKVDNYNKIIKDYPELSYSCYYIETDVDIDFINGVINHEIVEAFHGKLDDSIKKGALYINSPEEYQNYFYKTDHHWDVEGQLQGYKDIIRIIKGEDEEPLQIESFFIEGVKYNGYKSRHIGNYDIYDEFSVLWSELPEHEVSVNGSKSYYGSKKKYMDGQFSQEQGINHYGISNGGDFGLVEYKFNRPDKENLLVFVESFSNPINAFIASHFNNTYFIDLRYYEETFGKGFKFGEFIDKHNIEEVLFTGYYYFYAGDIFSIKD